MSEKLCLQWDDFKDNVNFAFGRLRNDKEFTNVTLACEDGQQIEAHKVVLAASSPFFEKILQKSKHPHPLIYLRGFHSRDFESILDFLYLGEANVYHGNLDSFFAIAQEIELKGLTNQTSKDLIQEQEESQLDLEPIEKGKDLMNKSTAALHGLKEEQSRDTPSTASNAVAIANTNILALDEKVKSMMEKGERMLPAGKQSDGTPKQAKSFICKLCGKEGLFTLIRDHIEANHLEGICIPCDFCDKTFFTQNALKQHKRKFHK